MSKAIKEIIVLASASFIMIFSIFYNGNKINDAEMAYQSLQKEYNLLLEENNNKDIQIEQMTNEINEYILEIEELQSEIKTLKKN